jgi:hypothetical protein
MDGTTQAIGANRTIVLEVARQALRVPSFPVERKVGLGELAALRQEVGQRVSWTAIFTRAYGLASRQHQQLRQIFVSWPWPRCFQSAQCVISIAVNRSIAGQDHLFFGRIHSPDVRSLVDIQGDLDGFQCQSPEVAFKSQIRGARLPWPIRRIGWWWRSSVDFRNKARRMGTGSISSLAGLGVTNRLHPCILTSSLSFSAVDSNGDCQVTLQCDHRVLDGVAAARALNCLCDQLTGQLVEELHEMANSRCRRSAA